MLRERDGKNDAVGNDASITETEENGKIGENWKDARLKSEGKRPNATA